MVQMPLGGVKFSTQWKASAFLMVKIFPLFPITTYFTKFIHLTKLKNQAYSKKLSMGTHCSTHHPISLTLFRSLTIASFARCGTILALLWPPATNAILPSLLPLHVSVPPLFVPKTRPKSSFLLKAFFSSSFLLFFFFAKMGKTALLFYLKRRVLRAKKMHAQATQLHRLRSIA